MALMESIEGRRILDDLLETAKRGGCAVAANQKRDLADESGYADEKQMPIRETLADRETVDTRSFTEECNRLALRNGWPGGGLQRAFKTLGLLRPAKLVQKFFAGDMAVGLAT